MWIITDWAGNILNFKGKFQDPCFSVPMEFQTFDDAWEYISENIPEDSHDDVYAEEKK